MKTGTTPEDSDSGCGGWRSVDQHATQIDIAALAEERRRRKEQPNDVPENLMAKMRPE
jgi:hypothetical protein